jgi:hypothetical protein
MSGNIICGEMPNEEILFLPNDRVAYQPIIGVKPILGIVKRIWVSGRFQILLDTGKLINVSRFVLIHLKIKRV